MDYHDRADSTGTIELNKIADRIAALYEAQRSQAWAGRAQKLEIEWHLYDA